jgi:hypothetical protein
MRKLDEIFQELTEQRSANLMNIVSSLRKLDFVEDIIDIHYLPNGITAFVRSKDGNAYEFIIRPAANAVGFEKFR